MMRGVHWCRGRKTYCSATYSPESRHETAWN